MLALEIPSMDMFNDDTQEFLHLDGTTLRLEHSLVSISKWESKWKKPFLSSNAKTVEETLDYIKCMTINQNVDDLTYEMLTPEHISKVNEYINDRKTATTFNDRHELPNRQVVTSELIYFWMAQFNIPFECQKWHLSRLLTLIKIASIQNSPKKKMSPKAILSQNASLNAARRKAMHSKG